MINRANYGARDEDIAAKAKILESRQADSKDTLKAAKSMIERRLKFDIQGLIPKDVMVQIPYKHVYEALSNETEDGEDLLKGLVCTTVAISLRNGFENFDNIESKSEKKDVMRAHVYLDALIQLNRMRPTAFDKEMLDEK